MKLKETRLFENASYLQKQLFIFLTTVTHNKSSFFALYLHDSNTNQTSKFEQLNQPTNYERNHYFMGR